ncbi:MAG TPA: hypothetical protein VNI01_01745 [Elusimicrobiota bacterium]|nr:hypothetical protein [Elusimicrobiota bacterium]
MPTASSKNLWRSLRVDQGPSRPEKETRALLTELCRKHPLHARLLNTFSWMEHVGSRKILLSQSGAAMSEDVLRHLAEEARHAHFFRKAAERVSARGMDYSEGDTLARASSRGYLERLDAAIARELGKERPLAYRYVTLAIELRAEWLYKIYEEVLRSEGVALTLSSVLSEEEAHLREMDDVLRETDPAYGPRRQVFEALESRLFERWLGAVRQAAFPVVPARAQWTLL